MNPRGEFIELDVMLNYIFRLRIRVKSSIFQNLLNVWRAKRAHYAFKNTFSSKSKMWSQR